jgi:hypothetical protein
MGGVGPTAMIGFDGFGVGVATGDAAVTGVGVAAVDGDAGTGTDDGPAPAGGDSPGTFATGPGGVGGARSG